MIYSALNIVVKRIRESRVIAFSVRKPYFSTLLAEVGNPAFSVISTENQGVSPRASRRGFLCPQKHAPGFFSGARIAFLDKIYGSLVRKYVVGSKKSCD